MAGFTEVDVVRFDPDGARSTTDRVATEAPLEIRLGTTPIAVLMRTPGQELELATGFCLTEGILLAPEELERVERLDGDRYRIHLADGVEVDPEQFRRNTYTTSSCGVCGKASIDAVRIAARPLPPGPTVDGRRIPRLIERLRRTQEIFDVTGGLHGAALLLPDGTVVASAEDVGRHNAVDKAIGAYARQVWPLGEVILVVSGRISFEIAQKAAVAGVPMVVGVSAGSSLAIDLAREVGMTLAGFVRTGSFVVYAGAHRIVG
ncbi:MAG TPA: formate dehydrogenase accessory sulfurtransferase FdhD [Acidimicrobiia bacterium]|nr:formate dehydrogenase accessory sulfurtransferase FdhD [Acidimicrobiia bacterium]